MQFLVAFLVLIALSVVNFFFFLLGTAYERLQNQRKEKQKEVP